MAKVNKGNGTDVVISGTNYDPEELAGITSFDDALNLVASRIGENNIDVASDEIGDGFKLLENKDQICGVPLLLVTWDFHMGDHGEFVSIKAVTKDGQKLIINDGSSGLYKQLAEYSAKKNKQGGMLCQKGLRRSDYKYTDENGNEKPATTYYLDVSV